MNQQAVADDRRSTLEAVRRSTHQKEAHRKVGGVAAGVEVAVEYTAPPAAHAGGAPASELDDANAAVAEPGSADAVQQILRDRAERMRRDAEDAQALRERLAARRIERDRWGAGPARPAAAAGDGREDRHVGSAQIPISRHTRLYRLV